MILQCLCVCVTPVRVISDHTCDTFPCMQHIRKKESYLCAPIHLDIREVNYHYTFLVLYMNTLFCMFAGCCQGSSKLQVLMDEWLETKGDWKSSKLYQHLKRKRSERQHGSRVWMTKQQLVMKYNCEQIATNIVEQKCSDPELFKTQTKPHPDVPDNEARGKH